MTDLIHFILFGEFGLLTMTPKYLFLVLFPIMVFLGIAEKLLTKLPVIGPHIFEGNLFYYFIGLGCTTAALTALDKKHHRVALTLILLIPCSSQIAIIACFAALVTTRVFLSYLVLSLFYICIISLIIRIVWRMRDCEDMDGGAGCRNHSCGAGCWNQIGHSNPAMHEQTTCISPSLPGSVLRKLCVIIKKAFMNVAGTSCSFCIGSVIVSMALYFGILDRIAGFFQPYMDSFLGLPPESITLLLFNVLKRDFGSASLLMLGGSGAFDAVSLVTLLMMMTFTVPCFNSTILLYKKEGPLWATLIWCFSLLVSLVLGKATRLFFGVLGI
ncbi:MAG: nucleoside recognition domain-containing protein [Eubacteriaceae bacterium]|nr:nucleoside recognition domain-containing protein [Eubacteriaceae bacterium]